MIHRFWKPLLVIWVLLILTATLIPGRGLAHLPDVSLISGADLWIHGLLFCGLGFIATSAYPATGDRLWQNRKVLTLLLAGTVFGGITELLQAVLPIQRDPSWFDFLADIAGLILGTIFRHHRFTQRKLRHLNLT